MGRITDKDWLPRLKENAKKRAQAGVKAEQEPRGNILTQLGFDGWSFIIGAEVGMVGVYFLSLVV